MGLALLFIIHIVYAVWLTLQNRKARGNDRYSINKRPATVEWSSQNMLVLGIVVLAFLAVHMIQFWAKMQLQEIRGVEGVIPPSIGTLFIQEAFSCVWTPIVYIIGFVALWFHMNHGFWSMFQSIGWDNATWLPRLKTIACWWTTIVIALFIAQAVVFTVNAHNDFYKKDPVLRDQYKEVIGKVVGIPADRFSYDQVPTAEDLQKAKTEVDNLRKNPQMMSQYGVDAAMLENQLKSIEAWTSILPFVDYLNDAAENVEAVEVEAVQEVQPEN